MYPMRTAGILPGRPNINENYRKTTSITWEHLLGNSTGSEMCQPRTLGQKLASISSFQDCNHSFSGLTNYSKNFYLSWCCSKFQQISKPNPIHFEQVSNLFQTKSQVPFLKHSTLVMFIHSFILCWEQKCLVWGSVVVIVWEFF